MAIILREATASQEAPLGPFLNSTDGDTPETGLTIAKTDIKLWKKGATTLVDKATGGATHMMDGVYYGLFNASDTDTPGPMAAFIHVAGALAVKVEFIIYTGKVYDSLFGSDKLEVDVVQISGDTTAADNCEKVFDDTGFDMSNSAIGTVATATSVTNDVGITQAGADKVWGSAARTLTSFGTLITDIRDSILDDGIRFSGADIGLIEATVNNATYGIEAIKRFVSNIAGFVKHGNGVGWHKATAYFWDPENGDDGNDGLTEETGKKTFAGTLALTMPYCHDSVNLVNSTGAPLVVDTKVNINIAKVHLIGDGNTTIKPTSVGASTVILSAKGTHVEGLNIETHTVGNNSAVEITADECEVHGVKIPSSRGSGVKISSANQCTIHDIRMVNPGFGTNGHGIEITGSSTLNRIHDFDICSAAGDGINLNGAGVTDNLIYSGDGTSIIHGSVRYGVQEEGGAAGNEIVGPKLLLTNNTLGPYLVDASTTVENVSQFARYTDLPANFVDMVITATTGLVDITQTAADKVWVSASRTLTSFGSLVVDMADAVWNELIADHVTADTFGKTVGDILARIGAFAGSGDNTLLGYIVALMRNDVSTPSGIGGTYSSTTHSNQAILIRGNIAWVSGTISGSGANNFNITIRVDDEFGVPLVGVGVKIMDSTSTTTLVLLGTKTNGSINVSLDNGSYKMYLDGGSAYQTVGGNPITLTVIDATAQEGYMAAFSPDAPVGVGNCIVSNWHKDASGAVQVGKIWYAKVTKMPTDAGDYLIAHKREASTASDSNGYNQLELIQSTEYEVEYEGKKYTITIPAESNATLVDLLPAAV